MLKERKVEDILDTKPKLVVPVDGKVVGNNRVLNTIELNIEINIPAKDNIKLIKFSNSVVDNMAVKDSKMADIVQVNPKLDILINNFNNIVLNKDKDVAVNKVINVIKIELNSIDVGITVF